MTLGVLEEALAGFPGCALVVSHDRWFLDQVATGILAFEGDGRVDVLRGQLQRLPQRRARPPQPRNAARCAPRPRPRTPRRAADAGPQKLSFKERQELAGIEAAIAGGRGARCASSRRALADPALYKERAAEVPALVARARRRAAPRSIGLYARWQELEAVLSKRVD